MTDEEPKKKRRRRPGAAPSHLSLYGMSLGDAVAKALRKEKPAGGWPDRPRRTYKKKPKTGSG